MWKKIDRILGGFEDGVMVVGLLSATFVLFTNIVLRYVFNEGLIWAEEYVRFATMWIVFVGAGGVARRKRHLSVSALIDSVGPKLAKTLTAITYIITISFVLFLGIYGFKSTFEMMGRQQVSSAMQLPMWLVYLPIGIAGLLMTIRFIQQFIMELFVPESEEDRGKNVKENEEEGAQ